MTAVDARDGGAVVTCSLEGPAQVGVGAEFTAKLTAEIANRWPLYPISPVGRTVCYNPLTAFPTAFP
jgi:hypothetical protein